MLIMQILKILLLIILFNPLAAYAQIPMTELKEIPWEQVEITESDSLMTALFKLHPDLTSENKHDELMEIQRSQSHIVNLNNDQYPDLIVYRTELYNENMIGIYLNTGNDLKQLIRRPGRITLFKKHSPLSPLRISMKSYNYSVPPYLAEYTELTYLPSQDTLIAHTTDFYDKTEFPGQHTLNIPFEITQPKYRLRKTPEIDNGKLKAPYKAGNIIQEVTKGDIGIALAEKTDKTGRVWWFVMMKNNITKNPDNYFFINTDETDRINNPCFGWLSSRYVKKLRSVPDD